MKNLLFFIALALLLSACSSPEKLLDKGDYESLIWMASKKLSGKKKKDVYVQALEKGFEKLTRRDMAQIEALKSENTAESWEDIISIANEIQHRQDKIEPFLPLVSESGYQAKFTFVHTNTILAEARTNAVLLYDKRLQDYVVAARKGSKASARTAYQLINRIQTINPDRAYPELSDEMLDLGLNKIFVRIENNSNALLPAHYEEELLAVDFRNAGSPWDRFYTATSQYSAMDFEVVLYIQDIFVSPEGLNQQQHVYTREVKDGWEYVLDERGNVKKDSLGNDIKKDKYVFVSATVVETNQAKHALIHARMEITNALNGNTVYAQPLEVENHFNYTSRNFFGDKRALDNDLANRIAPIPFPPDLVMIMDAFKAMKPKFFNEVRRFNYDQDLPSRT
jgi:hypothetical protein